MKLISRLRRLRRQKREIWAHPRVISSLKTLPKNKQQAASTVFESRERLLCSSKQILLPTISDHHLQISSSPPNHHSNNFLRISSKCSSLCKCSSLNRRNSRLLNRITTTLLLWQLYPVGAKICPLVDQTSGLTSSRYHGSNTNTNSIKCTRRLPKRPKPCSKLSSRPSSRAHKVQ